MALPDPDWPTQKSRAFLPFDHDITVKHFSKPLILFQKMCNCVTVDWCEPEQTLKNMESDVPTFSESLRDLLCKKIQDYTSFSKGIIEKRIANKLWTKVILCFLLPQDKINNCIYVTLTSRMQVMMLLWISPWEALLVFCYFLTPKLKKQKKKKKKSNVFLLMNTGVICTCYQLLVPYFG